MILLINFPMIQIIMIFITKFNLMTVMKLDMRLFIFIDLDSLMTGLLILNYYYEETYSKKNVF